jgi:hypothetical protein
MTKMPRVWEILREFKNLCRGQGWKISEHEDWVEINDEYHNFLWARDVQPSSFKKITGNRKCVVREGFSYRVVHASYTAWLFSKTPSESVIKTILENPDISKRTALYDLSPLLEGKNTCAKLNHTESQVFQEFESFLRNEFKIDLKPLPPLSSPEINSENFHIPELA